MPPQRRVYTRKKTGVEGKEGNIPASTPAEDESENKPGIRASKVRAQKKLEKIVSEELTDGVDNKPTDSFDLLYSSPMKQEVNFKPLSFWSKKVKDLEDKENVRKKKCGLYELSESDESTSSFERKKQAKKGKAKGTRGKKTGKNKCNPVSQYIMKELATRKEKQKTETKKEKKEGLILRERIILNRLNNQFNDKEDKFSFNTVSSFGLTSTPGRSEKLNVVGGSKFNFLSPIPNRDENGHPKIDDDKMMDSTPKQNLRKRGGREVLTNDHKRVSGEFVDPFINFRLGTSMLEINSEKQYFHFSNDATLISALNLTVRGCKKTSSFVDNTLNRGILYWSKDSSRSSIDIPRKILNPEILLMFDHLHVFYMKAKSIHFQGNTDVFNSFLIDYDFFSPGLNTRSSMSLPCICCTLDSTNKSADPVTDFEMSSNNSAVDLPVRNTSFTAHRRSNTANHSEICCKETLFDLPIRSRSSCYVTKKRGNYYGNFRRSGIGLEFNAAVNCGFAENEYVNTESKEFISGDSIDNECTVVRSSLDVQWMTADEEGCPNLMECKNQIDGNTIIKMEPTQFSLENDEVSVNIDNDSSVYETSREINSVIKVDREENRENPCIDETSQHHSPEKDFKDMTPEEILFGSPIERIREQVMSDFTIIDEDKFPLPMFESTVCKTPNVGNRIKFSGIGNVNKTKTDEMFTILEPENKEKSEVISSANNTTLNFKLRKKVSECMEKSEVPEVTFNLTLTDTSILNLTSLKLKPGKQWARSSSVVKKLKTGSFLSDMNNSRLKGKNYQSFVQEVISMQIDEEDEGSESRKLAVVTDQLSNLTMNGRDFGNRTVKIMKEAPTSQMECTFRSVFERSLRNDQTALDDDDLCIDVELTPREVVLSRCGQTEPLPFEEFFNKKTLKNCKKIGEGVFGEVFMCNPNKRVIKIMPIEGADEVNGEPQKKFDEILSEMVIAMELSNLRSNERHKTSGFSELKRCWCVYGKYPEYLLDLWHEFDSTGRGSDNDSPAMFKSDQLYIVLEFANGGHDLEAFVFNSAEQSLSVFIQAAASLAVAEKVLEFEHRDLHWGNILIAPTRDKYFKIVVDGVEYKLPTKGVKVTIIDFTLSRISYAGCSIYNDLSVDPTLFTSQGDYQFEIYRMMKNEVENDWSVFRPKTNLYWLHYVLDKMVTLVRYRKKNTRIHMDSIECLKSLKSVVLRYSNSMEFFVNEEFS